MIDRVRLLLGLATLHTALLVTSNVAGGKLIALPFGLQASATVLSYTLTFVVIDSIAEIYDRSVSKFVIYIGLAGMMLSATYLGLATILPPAPGFHDQEAFSTVILASWRVWGAGWLAYVASQRLDLWLYLHLKRTSLVGPAVAMRAWLSMAVGQFADTVIFATIAFWGTAHLAQLVLGQYAIKLLVACLSAPLVSGAVAVGRRVLRDQSDAVFPS